MKTVLFVCSGNTCRSPMAEAIFNDALEGRPRLCAVFARARSAGTFAWEGASMAKNAELALENLGIRPPAPPHRATPFTQELAEGADLILAMQGHHLEEIIALWPDAEHKANTLKGFARGEDGRAGACDIQDPFGASLGVYEAVALEILDCVRMAMDRLERELPEA